MIGNRDSLFFKMAILGKSGKAPFTPVWTLWDYHRLAKTAALINHPKNVIMVGEPVEEPLFGVYLEVSSPRMTTWVRLPMCYSLVKGLAVNE